MENAPKKILKVKQSNQPLFMSFGVEPGSPLIVRRHPLENIQAEIRKMPKCM
jgi:hypothetical protein